MDITRPPGHGYLSEIRFEIRRTCANYFSPAYCHFNFQGLMAGWSEKVNYRLLSIKQDCYRKKSISDMT